MPCRDYAEDWGKPSAAEKEAEIASAGLCAILSILDGRQGGVLDGILANVDWKEAGITKRQLLSWWKKHQAKDAERRARELQEAREKELKEKALSKLTDEEKKALGVK